MVRDSFQYSNIRLAILFKCWCQFFRKDLMGGKYHGNEPFYDKPAHRRATLSMCKISHERQECRTLRYELVFYFYLFYRNIANSLIYNKDELHLN